MKDNISKNKSIIIICIFLAFFIFIGGIIFIFFNILGNIFPKTETLKIEKISPDGHYTIKGYLINTSALDAYKAHCELIDNYSNKKTDIYWQREAYDIKVDWENNCVVNINGHILNVPNDVYNDS